MLSRESIVFHGSVGNVSHNIRKLVLRGDIAANARPGQFVHIQVGFDLSFDPLLRRPISISQIDKEKNEITLLYKVIGKGTKLLAHRKVGEQISVMGPLGQGFTVPQNGELWLVGGGIGIFPLYALAQEALKQNITVRLFWGGQSHEFLLSAGLNEWQKLNLDMHLSTLDGSAGYKGFVTDMFKEYYLSFIKNISQSKNDSEKISVAACGPQGMMKTISEICVDFNIPVEVSLEERMGCAVGACLGCACTLKKENGEFIRKKVCVDGPVFRGEEVVWDETC